MSNIEEDIKILEDLKKDFISLVSKKDGFVIEKDKRKKQIRAIENIINRNRYLETKAAAKINNEIDNIKVEIFKNYIPVSLVEEKIEKYKNKIDKLYNQKVWNEPMDTIYKNRYVNYINILQELLEKRK